MSTKKTSRAAKPRARKRVPSFDLDTFLASAGVARTVTKYASAAVLFSQGDPAAAVFYLQQGSVKLSVLSRGGKEAVVAILGPGDFFGEGCLAGQPQRMATATALRSSAALIVEKPQMLQILHTQPSLADRFLSHMLARNIRIEEDLIDHLFNSSEKRLARVLLLLARFGKEGKIEPVIPKISQEVLAEMVGTTRPRISGFMNKFRKLGFIEYNGDIKVNRSLMTVVLHD